MYHILLFCPPSVSCCEEELVVVLGISYADRLKVHADTNIHQECECMNSVEATDLSDHKIIFSFVQTSAVSSMR